jgi:hypothetical protein
MSEPLGWASPRGLALGGLALAVLATFAEALPSSRTFFERDIHAYWYAHRAALRSAIAEGAVPLWNPWVGFGAPFLADASSELAYPLTWLALPLPLSFQFDLFAVAHGLLAAAGAFVLARRVGLAALPGAVAGGSYALAGPLLSALGLYHHFAGAAWLPWVLWALEGLLRRPSRGRALALGGVSACQILAGSGDLVLMTALMALGRVLLELGRRPGRAALTALARGLALAAALALGIGAVQWLPTVERAVHGHRAAQDLRTRAYWSLHPRSLVDLVVPRLVSQADLSPAERELLFEGREPLLSCIYVGVVTMALAGLALTLREPPSVPLAAGLAAFTVTSLGRHTPLYAWLVEVPGFGLLRYPQKYLLPASLCLALLAAVGAAAFLRGWSASDRRRARGLAVALLLTACALVALTWPPVGGPAALKLRRSALLLALASFFLWRRGGSDSASPALTAGLLLMGALDLVAVGRGTNPVAPALLYDHRPPVLERLRGTTGRIHAAAESAACLAPGTGPAGWESSWVAALGFLDTLRPPAGVRWGLRGSYDGEFTGLGPRWAAPLTETVHARLGTPEGLRLLQLGGVERVVFLGHGVPAGLERLETLETPLACPLQLLRVPTPLPPAFVVSRERPEAGDPLAALVDPLFDPRAEAVLAGAARAPGGEGGQGTARIVSRTTDTLEVEAELDVPGVLVVTEAFDEGWRAEVDGRAAEVVRANGLFRGVRLAAGRHRVRFRYRPAAALAGAAISGLGLVAAIALGVTQRRGERD